MSRTRRSLQQGYPVMCYCLPVMLTQLALSSPVLEQNRRPATSFPPISSRLLKGHTFEVGRKRRWFAEMSPRALGAKRGVQISASRPDMLCSLSVVLDSGGLRII